MEPLSRAPRATPAVDDLVEALLVSAAYLTCVLGHMSDVHALAGPDSEADPPPILLRRLLRGALAPLADRFAAADLELAARLVNRATAIAERELIVVDPSPFDGDDGE